ncbi:hypothetical protein SCP_0800350 [Sparassis crispa]|uniref:C3H1-type domain-containing protein n=1 Tax=Sparassis crispa TaxID=139825 RepID=A0A401GTG4_9APHY|nr:hypothetical protein SCP_0800350 [Sparassis crispa]GBE85518.1 hypothetical protein SCP_0800350 [Sparassis crispa]
MYSQPSKVPCKFHNHQGCRSGTRCPYKHTLDERRDNIGRNVCKMWLLDACSHPNSCYYAHDRTFLPRQGWWADRQHLEEMRQYAQELQYRGMRQKDIERAVDARWPGWAVIQDEYIDDYDVDDVLDDAFDDALMEERAENFGFTQGEMEDLLCQGVKPWDDDAWDVLGALRDM